MWQDLWKSLEGVWSRNCSKLVQISGIDFSSPGVCLWAGNFMSICKRWCAHYWTASHNFFTRIFLHLRCTTFLLINDSTCNNMMSILSKKIIFSGPFWLWHADRWETPQPREKNSPQWKRKGFLTDEFLSKEVLSFSWMCLVCLSVWSAFLHLYQGQDLVFFFLSLFFLQVC